MPRDIESELRRSLEARAADVSPDPALYSRVQSRIRRGRTFRLALAGVAGALAIAGIAVAAPAVINNRIEFEPQPVATQPGPEATPTELAPAPRTAAPYVFTDGSHVLLGGSGSVLGATGDEGMSAVAVQPGSTARDLTLAVAEGECGIVRTGQWSPSGSEPPAPGPGADVPGQVGCATTPLFSPDGEALVWAASTADGWSIHTVDWTDAGPGEDDASFGLPWPADQPVDIQEWVWTEQTSTTASGFLVVRTQRNGGWMLLAFPIERQADGALAMTLEPGMLGGDTGGQTPVAYASGGGDASNDEDITYTMAIDMARAGIEGGQLIRRVGAETDGVFELPPELFNNTNPPFDVADLWMSASGDTVLYGNAGEGMAWSLDWTDATPTMAQVTDELSTVHADLLTARQVPAEGTGPPIVQTEVDVYFGMEGADACVASSPVVRTVEGAGVARGALTELLAGPTPQESNSGIVSPFNANTAGALNDIVIADGQAQVDFADFSADVGNDSCTKSAIIDALDSTLLQFPTVTSTQYSFDGSVDAWEQWLGSAPESPEEMPAAVAATAEEILAAAQARDWPALRRLSEGTSCTMSDQPEPCVPYWRDQEANGEDPMGILVEVMQSRPARAPDTEIWAWPAEWFEGDGYSGPRVGIDADGRWLYFVQEGG